MIEIPEFAAPDFLSNSDVETIHDKMMSMLPADIDKTEGGFPWDFTRPTALIASEMLQFHAVELLKLMFPQWSRGVYLEMITGWKVTRKPANAAAAKLTITGMPGTVIPEGTVFCTEALFEIPSIEFATEQQYVIPDNGTIEIVVTAVETGPGSNVDADTIVLMSVPIKGIISVTNKEKASGGTDPESDDSLRQRYFEALQNQDASYIGNNADYKRWAESVPGMGTAIIVPEWNGPETVKIVCADANGEAANEVLCQNIYNYIMAPDSPLDRLAPPNVILTVCAPTLVQLDFTVTVVLTSGYTADQVKNSFMKALGEYYKIAAKEGMVRYVDVSSVLTGIAGVEDHEYLKINGDDNNIRITLEQYPATGTITITEASEVHN